MPAPLNHPPFAGCETGGRPRRYSTEDIERYADELKVWLTDPSHVWFKDFCLDNDINPDLMSEWAEENEKFSGAHALAKHRQESRLVNGGLVNAYNGAIVKLVLANAHGWKTDKTETKVSGDAAAPLKFLLDKIDGKGKELVANESE
jgi:hypothetical protein